MVTCFMGSTGPTNLINISIFSQYVYHDYFTPIQCYHCYPQAVYIVRRDIVELMAFPLDLIIIVGP